MSISKITIICVFTALYLASVKLVSYQGKEFYSDRIEPKVYDISHKYLPKYMGDQKKYKDCIFIILGVVLVVFGKEKKFEIVEKIVGLFITIVLMRCITTSCTILPKTTRQCQDNQDDLLTTFGIGKGNCYDLIFSGHFALGFIITLVFFEYKLISILFLIFFNIINAGLILTTRSHYTIDIIVSFLATMFVYQNNFNIFTNTIL